MISLVGSVGWVVRSTGDVPSSVVVTGCVGSLSWPSEDVVVAAVIVGLGDAAVVELVDDLEVSAAAVEIGTVPLVDPGKLIDVSFPAESLLSPSTSEPGACVAVLIGAGELNGSWLGSNALDVIRVTTDEVITGVGVTVALCVPPNSAGAVTRTLSGTDVLVLGGGATCVGGRPPISGRGGGRGAGPGPVPATNCGGPRLLIRLLTREGGGRREGAGWPRTRTFPPMMLRMLSRTVWMSGSPRRELFLRGRLVGCSKLGSGVQGGVVSPISGRVVRLPKSPADLEVSTSSAGVVDASEPAVSVVSDGVITPPVVVFSNQAADSENLPVPTVSAAVVSVGAGAGSVADATEICSKDTGMTGCR